MFEPFAEVPAVPARVPVFWGAAAFFVLAMARHLRVFAAARAAGPRPLRPARLAGTIRYALVQTRMFRDLQAGVMHFGIFWGFVLLTIGTANIVTGGLIQAVLSIPFDGAAVGRGHRDAERGRRDRPRVRRVGVLAARRRAPGAAHAQPPRDRHPADDRRRSS